MTLLNKTLEYEKFEHGAAALVRIDGIVHWRFRGRFPANSESVDDRSTIDFVKDSFTTPQQVILYVNLMDEYSDIPEEMIYDNN